MRQMKPADRKDKIAVVVGTVTNDVRILEVPKLTVSCELVSMLERENNHGCLLPAVHVKPRYQRPRNYLL